MSRINNYGDRTHDEHYTPPAVYDAILDWCRKTIPAVRDARRILRPFCPGGDYQSEEYRPGDVIVDNPPFSILHTEIVPWLLDHGVAFVLVMPQESLSTPALYGCCFVNNLGGISFDGSGKQVKSALTTNLIPGTAFLNAPDLFRAVQAAAGHPVRETILPPRLLSYVRAEKLARYGHSFAIPSDEVCDATCREIYGDLLAVSPQAWEDCVEAMRPREPYVREIPDVVRAKIAEMDNHNRGGKE